MNRYEKLGRAIVAFVATFIGCFAFSATFMVFYRLNSDIDSFNTLIVCTMVGLFFGLFGGSYGYVSEC